MNFPSSTFGGDPSTATLARISTEFDAIARQMSPVSAEFAELRRIVAQPDTGAYGRLAVLGQWRSDAKIAMKVHRSAFTPPPKVMSAIVHVTPAAAPEGISMSVLARVTEAAFGQRRKMLRQSLKGVPGALDALETLGINPARRAETISIAEFCAVARALS